jgi:hypothetical protein
MKAGTNNLTLSVLPVSPGITVILMWEYGRGHGAMDLLSTNPPEATRPWYFLSELDQRTAGPAVSMLAEMRCLTSSSVNGEDIDS